MLRRTLLECLATTPLIGTGAESGGGGQTIHASLSFENTEGASYTEATLSNPTREKATITVTVETPGDYPSGELPTVTLTPGEQTTTGIGSSPQQPLPETATYTLSVEWD